MNEFLPKIMFYPSLPGTYFLFENNDVCTIQIGQNISSQNIDF